MRNSPLTPLLLLLAATSTTAIAEAAPGHVLCRTMRLAKVSGVSAFQPYTRLRVRDRLTPDGRVVDVRKPVTVCMPAGADGAAIDAGATPLTGYQTHLTRLKPAQPRFTGSTVDVQAPWGVEQLKVLAPDDLLVPAALATDPADAGPAAGLDELACYTVKTRRAASGRVVPLDGPTMPAAIAVTRPVRLCVPSDFAGTSPGALGKSNAWLCLAARMPKGAGVRADDARDDVLVFRDRFGRTAMKLGAPSELCVAATIGAPVEAPTATPTVPAASATPTPQATPSPSPSGPAVVSMRVEPPHVVRMLGESYAFTAIATLSDGSERNATEDVVWSCDFSCDAPNTPGDRGRVDAHSWDYQPPFDYWGDVYATDPLTGIVSPYVTFEVSSDPIPLVIYPDYTVIREHTFDYLTALALDEQGAYRNATQDVVWSSNDPSIAAVTNVDGERSRIDGIAPGITQIYAIDPRSGAVSSNATFDVFGPLNRMDIYTYGRSILNTKETIDVGQTIAVSAWAYFERGFHFEGFEPLTFTSSQADVATIEQLPDSPSYMLPNGLHQRVIRGLTPGTTRISARDDLTRFSTSDSGCETRVTVRQPVSSLRLSPPTRTAGLDETVKLTALGVGSDAATRNYTQRVVYTSSNPSVAIATNESGDRSKIVTVGPGTTFISAVDPATGLATNISGGNTTLTVRNERVDRIAVSVAASHVPQGAFPRFRAIGHYPSGASATITESVKFTSSDPQVADFSYFGGGTRIYTVGDGTTVVSAVMTSLGIGSTASGGDATLSVEPVVSLQVLPAATAIAVGDERRFHVVAKLAGGTEIDLGNDADLGDGYVALATSDPVVARATDACEPHPGELFGLLSAVLGRAPGTVTISARGGHDPTITSTATGGDATLTVTP